MSHFYLTLPSNSSKKYYPDNTLTHFVTKLHDDYSLNGDWELGLAEIRFPRTWFNIAEGESIFITCTDCVNVESSPNNSLRLHKLTQMSYTKEINIGFGYYASPEDLVKEINSNIEREFSKPIEEWTENDVRKVVSREGWPLVYYNPINKRVYVALPPYMEWKFTQKLGLMLGFKKRNQILTNRTPRRLNFRSNKSSDVDLGLNAMFVYCYLLECISIGDTVAPLLRIVDVQGKHGTTIHHYYEKPRYVPLQKKHFDSVEILIRDDVGDPIAFESGKLIVTLHFKRAKRDYFTA